MSLPYFFVEQLGGQEVVLDEDSSKHVISVLRRQKGEAIGLTDGKGKKVEAIIIDDNRKRCTVAQRTMITEPKKQYPAIGISLIKNTSRFEWFLEKATEIGVSEIIPLLCERTEKEKFRTDRLRQILVSAMLQSQQCWLPLLHEPTSFEKALALPHRPKFIAHCLPGEKNMPRPAAPGSSPLMLIGPEGDFTPAEVEAAIGSDCIPVSLGATRLRTETAGLVALVQLRTP
ncbi:MAG TPA: RsmE family RNA methyltransferase [Flavisolibacter sp.]|nr:RsmE family RNA methyltransferase [Flavisolibacter sp.]